MLVWICLSWMLVTDGAQASFTSSGEWLQYATPVEAGFSSEALEAARQLAESGNTAAMMVIYKGQVLTAWGRVEDRYKCHSVRKSIYSALMGIYAREGKFDLDKTLAELGIEDRHDLTEVEKTASVRQLITATSGIYHPAAKEPVSMKQRRPERGSHKPGEHFWYNNWGFNTSTAILEQEANIKLFDAFRERLAKPLGMQDFRERDGFAELDRSASKYPAYAFRLSARDLARFGQLFLQKGRWQDHQIIEPAWIEESTANHIDNPKYGYGYMWWTLEKGAVPNHPDIRAYYASGLGGQMILVCDALDTVIVHRGDTDHNRLSRMGEIMEVVYKIFLAREGAPKADPKLIPMQATPLESRLAASADREFTRLTKAQMQHFEGRYDLGDGMIGTVRALDDRLIVGHSMLGEIDMFPATQTSFSAWNSNIDLTFKLDDSGKAVAAEINAQGRKIVGKRLE